MSEYQYYEFRAIDRPLTDRQMQELRAVSTRATISRTSFSNDYSYGDLKADRGALLLKYFDASLYFAHWCYLEIAFRYPKSVVDAKALRRYAAGHAVDIRSKGSDVVITLSLESDGQTFDAADDGSGWLSSLAGLRAEIASGDERVLYLAWLLDVQCGLIPEQAVEPARPAGLGRLSPALASFVDIFGLAGDLVAAAAEGDSKTPREPSSENIRQWLVSLSSREHVAWLGRVAHGDGGVSAEIMRRFRQHETGRLPSLPLRKAGELRARAEAVAEERRTAADEREARERARREREQQVVRDRYLGILAKHERQTWQRVDALVATMRPGDYDAAVALLVDLRDVSRLKKRDTGFVERIRALRVTHATKPSLLRRLKKAGL